MGMAEIPHQLIIEKVLPPFDAKRIKLNLNTFFVEHQLAKDAVNRCNFEQGFLYFGESQQSKGRVLEHLDNIYKQRLITSEVSNDVVNFIHNFNDTKIREFLDLIRKCKVATPS